ncbi:Na+/melibiose symporter-like transporter [Kribbella orskensis]|uniref:Na+/melibiose symporter-like transporter n=1 Tax=Kribbella orskensis TaxID=2512216 RepID=A0ABY2BQX2_9ACTN|nr:MULTISPECIES: MFS transporter [Kribbella]TCN39854.1 Na+/melibiose symporter-like transporter [Kribbella sp. VKM Ac-2500]TCO27363.1 Na+/melibiose symporter-like transporter [Kribbella orskensis]
MRAMFSSPGFRRLFAGMATSMFGDSVMLLVLSMWVKSLTGSNAQAGLTFFWMVVPTFIAPLFGLFVDRLRSKLVLAWGSLASAIAVLPLTLVRDAGDVWIVWGVAFLYGISMIVLPAALNGLLKEIVSDEQLVQANSSLQTVKEGFRLVGPIIGAGLFAWLGGWAVAVLDAATFVAAAVVIGSMALQDKRPARSEGNWLTEMSGGVRHLWSDRILRHTLVGLGLMLLVLGFSEASIYAIIDVFEKPVEFVSVIVTVQGIGALLGGLTATWWVRRIGEVGAFAVGALVLAAALGVIAATESLPVLLFDVPLFGYSIPLVIVAFMTLIQRRTPLRLMGRASTAVEVVMGTPQAASLAFGSVLVSLVSYHVIFMVMAIVVAGSVLYLCVTLRGQVLRPVAAWQEPSPEQVTVVGVLAEPLERT